MPGAVPSLRYLPPTTVELVTWLFLNSLEIDSVYSSSFLFLFRAPLPNVLGIGDLGIAARV